MDEVRTRPWHAMTGEEVCRLLGSVPERGLSAAEAVRRLRDTGPNRLTPQRGKSRVVVFLLQFHQPLVHILLASAVVTLFLRALVDAGVILGVVLVNAVIGYLQETRASRAMAALARSLEVEATVLRDGERRRISADGVVPGDLVLLQSGDRVPADLRLLSCRELRIDEAMLTGESLPVAKASEPLPDETPLADRLCMAWSGTLVTYGTAAGVAVETGDRTEVGRISRLIAGADPLETPLTRRVARFSGRLLWGILGFALVAFAAGIARGESWAEMLMAAVALAVGAIPEGLPAAMTITLAIGASRMAGRNAIIRRLPAVETLGSTTVICSDKTGTLTRNRMEVGEIVAGGERFTVRGEGNASHGGFLSGDGEIDPADRPALRECLLAGLLCNDAVLLRNAGSDWTTEGDPTEGALVVAAARAGMAQTCRERYPRLDAVPFESQHRYMATLHDDEGRRFIYLKGAVETLLPRCGTQRGAAGGADPLDASAVERLAEEMAARGLRVLAFACRPLPADAAVISPGDLTTGLTFIGLQGILDPPRPEAVRAVQSCREAGIRVVMITGDHRRTAEAIAAAVGIVTDGGSLTGREMEALSARELAERVAETSVFARVAPEQKLGLVRALQGRGEVVAMTGDGVNDAPALRQADIGIAMGRTGTEVAREAAAMVLTDDNFATIEAAVEEGRGVFDNLQKFIVWTLPTNIGEGLVILVAICAGVTLPILPVQILWINMTTAVLLGLMLAFEPVAPGIMRRPPRPPVGPVVPRRYVVRMVLVGLLLLACAFGLFRWELLHGETLNRARTAAVNVFVAGELCYLFNCRSLDRFHPLVGLFANRWLVGGVVFMALLQLLFTYHPVCNLLFHSEPVGASEWGFALLAGGMIFGVVELEKSLVRRWQPQSGWQG